MEGLEQIDKECSALGGLFQQIVHDMKNGVPFYEDVASKAAKLHTQLKNTIQSLGAFLDAFQKIADAATNARGSTREIGACLTRIVIRHKSMESRLKTLCSALLDCMILPLQDKLEDWKKSISVLDKEHAKDYKKLRSEFKKKTESYARLQKKNKKNAKNGNSDALDNSMSEVTKHIKLLQDTERNAVRKVLTEERSRYCTFVACLKPLIDEEVFMVTEFQQLEEVSKKLSNSTEDPFKLPAASEQVITDIISTKNGEPKFHFQTPPSSPSSLGSRKSSMCSISSAGSSAGSPSHQANNNLRLRSLSQHNNPSLGPMRLSSISSQDSGFTSQDTLFIRPHSPTSKFKNQALSRAGGEDKSAENIHHNVGGAPPPGDRPHTISSAYEKGHQRPQLQPYTFAPLPMNEIIEEHNEGTTPTNNNQPRPGANGTLLRRIVSSAGSHEKPPVPQRSVTLETPNKHGLPAFHANKEDMVLPQPVYMNMNDLAMIRKQKPCEEEDEDAYDLKTPTAEELSVPEAKNGDGSSSNSESSLGSSSGYGSQITMKIDEQQKQQFQHHDGTSMLHYNGSSTLRRSNTSGPRPPPPTRHSSSSISSSSPPPPPPAPLTYTDDGSDSATPRGSMERLPPPPPHLLHSDDEVDHFFEQKRSPPEEVISQRGFSVADSVKALQNLNHKPASPKTLRRAHSVSAADCGRNPAELQHQQKRVIEQCLSSKLRGVSVSHKPPLQQERIYAPVAHLQQKIQQQQRQQLQQQQSPVGSEQYGFGMQFYQHQNQFYTQQQQQQENNSMTNSPSSVSLRSNHDQIMRDIDEKMRQRPDPPPMPARPTSANRSTFSPASYEDQTSDRVRRWIESKSVSNVRDCRPYLNAEIKQGFALRKTSTNDRSAPRL